MILLRRGLLNPTLEDMNINSFIDDTLASGTATKNIALSTPVDLTKAAIAVVTQSCDVNTTDRSMVRFDFVDASTVRVTREDGTSGTVSFQIEVQEFPKAVSVQFFSTTLGGVISTTQAISTVNGGANRIVFRTSATSNDASDIRAMMMPALPVLTNDTLVTLTRSSAVGNATTNFFVIELLP